MSRGAVLNLAARFVDRAGSRPDRVALKVGAASVSYGELARLSGAIAGWLERSGGDGPVGILAKRSVRAYAAVLAACRMGLPYVPISPDIPVERQAALAGRAKIRFLVADRNVDPRVLEAGGFAVLRAGDAPEAADPALRDAPPDSVAYVMFTSGTTGTPKAVRVPVSAVDAFLRAEDILFPVGEDDRVSQFYELNFDPSVFDIFVTLGAGAALHVVPDSQRMAPGPFIRGEKLTVWSSVPSVLGFMARTRQLAPGAFPSVRASMFCGEPLPAASLDAWRKAAPNCALVANQYGPTETTVVCTGENLGAGPPALTAERGIVSIGVPFPGTGAAIVDADLKFLPPGEKGELALCGSQLALGYDDAELTARRFPWLDHPQLGRQRWYLSGDLARADADGRLHHLGRVDHQVKITGHRVELEEIEVHLCEVSGSAAVVVPWPFEAGVAAGLVAFIVAGGWQAASVQQAVAQRLPAYMVPKRIVALPSLPAAPNGKLDRKALSRMLEDGL